MISKKIENFSRRLSGKEVLDQEITSFLKAKHSDTQGDGSEKSDRSVRFELHKYFDDLELRPDLLQNKRVLDLGSSDHFFDDYVKEKYSAETIALDVERDSLGKKHDLGVIADVRALPFGDSIFDLVH